MLYGKLPYINFMLVYPWLQTVGKHFAQYKLGCLGKNE